MLYHPERKKEERFVGNIKASRGIPSYFSELKTIRLGEIAYDIHNKKLDTDYMSPLFVGLSEYSKYDLIMMNIKREGK